MENETQIRLIAFISLFAVMALWECIAPYRRLRYSKLQRWPHQLTLIVINSVVLKFCFRSRQSVLLYGQLTGESGSWMESPVSQLYRPGVRQWPHYAHRPGDDAWAKRQTYRPNSNDSFRLDTTGFSISVMWILALKPSWPSNPTIEATKGLQHNQGNHYFCLVRKINGYRRTGENR